MKIRIVVLLGILALSGVGFALRVVATLYPYYLIVSEISRGVDEVSLLVEPGVNPHTFSLKVSQAKMLAMADLVVANGLNMEPYLHQYAKKTLYVGEAIPRLFLSDEDDGGVNPHVWLDPFFVKYYIVPTIVEKLSEMNPKARGRYFENAKKMIEKLDAIIRRMNTLLTPYAGYYVILTHPSFYYFFHEYSINVLSIEEGHGKKPPVSHLKELVEIAKGDRVLGLFHEPQLDDRTMKVIAKESGRSYTSIDPLGIEAKSVEELFSKALDAVEEVAHR